MTRTFPSPDLLDALAWRYATQRFDVSRTIDAPTWSALEQSLVLSASSFGLQPWKFIVVTDPAVRATLRAAAWNQPQITDASRLVVFARKLTVTVADVDRYIARIAEVRGTAPELLAGFRASMVDSMANPAALPGGGMAAWTRSQVYIALGQFLTAAAVLGVDTCPIEGFDADAYNKTLNLPAQGYSAVVVAAAGHRSAEDVFSTLPKVRFKAEDVISRV